MIDSRIHKTIDKMTKELGNSASYFSIKPGEVIEKRKSYFRFSVKMTSLDEAGDLDERTTNTLYFLKSNANTPIYLLVEGIECEITKENIIFAYLNNQ